MSSKEPQITDEGIKIDVRLIEEGIAFLKDELHRRPDESQPWKTQVNRTIAALHSSHNFIWAMAAKGAISE